MPVQHRASEPDRALKKAGHETVSLAINGYGVAGFRIHAASRPHPDQFSARIVLRVEHVGLASAEQVGASEGHCSIEQSDDMNASVIACRNPRVIAAKVANLDRPSHCPARRVLRDEGCPNV